MNKTIEETTIDTWKLELSELLYCTYNEKPHKGLGYIPNQGDINNFVEKLVQAEKEQYLDEFKQWFLENEMKGARGARIGIWGATVDKFKQFKKESV